MSEPTTDAADGAEPDEDAAPAAAPPPSGALAVVRRVPFTASVVALMLVLGVVTGTLWSALQDRDLFDVVAYGLPAFRDGRWWTVVTGSLFALTPLQYLPVAGGFALLVGWSEWRFGTRRTAIAAISTQAVGVLGAALLLALLEPTGWGWAVRIADDLDVGFSAGAIGAVAAATAVVSPPWRGRIRYVLVLYIVLALLYLGVLWDVEHLIGGLLGLAMGPYLAGRRPELRRPRASMREWRLLAASFFLVAAIVRLVLWFVPSDGPLGAASDDTNLPTALIGAAVSLLIANGLRKGRRRTWIIAMVINGLALALIAFLVIAVLVSPDLVAETEQSGAAAFPAFLVDFVLWVLGVAVLIAGRSAFRAPGGRALTSRPAEVAAARGEAISLLQTHGGGTLGWMGTWPGMDWFVLRTGRGPVGYVAFQRHRGVAVALADAVGPDAATRDDVLDAFVAEQTALGQQFALFSVTQEVVDWATSRGYGHVQVATEAVIDLPTLEFKGKAWQDVRTALNRAGKEGITYVEGRLAEMPRPVLAQVRAISEVWVSDKALPEMGFTLGGVDEALDPDTVVGLAVGADGTVHGVTSWLPVHGADGVVRGRTLDVMRRLPDGFRPVTEFLIASACLSFKEQGCELVSLSGAPLARAGDPAEAGVLDALLDQLGQTLEPLYGFRSLESFKAKFKPRDVPLFLVFPDEAALPRIGLALTEAFLPGTPLPKVALAGMQGLREARD
ncbi:MAG: bifunctional lysylphosphatidylglycerol flippase/synthetase MprF [Candidatus Nanopelagicales bacterium]